MELKCQVQNYAWGKIGTKSLAAEFAANGRPDDFCVDGTAPYAELWMGTHPNGPSIVKDGHGSSLAEYIEKNPSVLGESSRKLFGDNLPFLFKVLSVNKALSIQAHPDKKHAEELHKLKPDIYKDPNHKPEMAIALTDFQGLCGFRPLTQIQNNIKEVAQLRQVIGQDCANALLKATADNYQLPLESAFASLMTCSKEKLMEALESLKQEIEKKKVLTSTESLFKRLAHDFPGDVGCFVIYFLNLLALKPGEAMFLGPNLPHAYLSGDCIECMACSDNVVRAGLTPKLIDVPTLCRMLIYQCPENPDTFKFKPRQENTNALLYDPPVPDFSVAKLLAPKGHKVSFPSRESASIVIFTDCGRSGSYSASKNGSFYVENGQVKKGLVLFLAAKDVLQVTPDDKEDVVAFQAFC